MDVHVATPSHRKKKEKRQCRRTKKKDKNSARLAAVHYQDKKMERAERGARTQQAQQSISSSCDLLWRLRPEAKQRLSGNAERAPGEDDHCAASVGGRFLPKGKQVGASFTQDAAGGDDLVTISLVSSRSTKARRENPEMLDSCSRRPFSLTRACRHALVDSCVKMKPWRTNWQTLPYSYLLEGGIQFITTAPPRGAQTAHLSG